MSGSCSSFSGDGAPVADNAPDGGSSDGGSGVVTGTAADDSFQVQVSTMKVVVLQGGKGSVSLSVTRGNDVKGPIEFTIGNLPDGLTATNTTLAAGENQLDISLNADLLAPQKLAHVTTVGTTADGGGKNASQSVSFDILLRGPAGALDTTFGANGRLVVDPNGADDTNALLILGPHDEIYTYSVTDPTCQGQSFCLARYTSDGSVDTAFGTMGKAPAPAATAGAVLPDNRFVGAGLGPSNSTVVYRLLANGAPDEAFGGNGNSTNSVTYTQGTNYAPNNVALDTDGSFAVTFPISKTSQQTPFVGIARFDANGLLVSGFEDVGDPGFAAWGPNNYLRMPSVALKKTHQVILAVTDGPSFMTQWDAIEYDTSAKPLLSFGTNGSQHGAIGSADNISEFRGTVLFSDESFLFAVAKRLVKLTPAGQLDMTFGGGTGTLDMVDFVYAVAHTPDDKVVALTSPSVTGAPTITRLDATGKVDASFGGAGATTLDATINVRARLAVQSDGRVLAMASQTIYRLWQ